MSEIIKNRYDFVVLFDVKNGNPNGDPDAGNMPRLDPETGRGLVTDVCIKRKIRNYVQMVKGEEEGFDLYIKESATLNASDIKGGELAGVGQEIADLQSKSETTKNAAKAALKKQSPEIDRKLRDFMCKTFYDIRTFGAVMTTFVRGALNCGQVRGPVQLSFAESVDPIVPREITITRVAITTEEDADKKGTEMGNKFIVPYGLYRMSGFVSANLAQRVTGFSEEDLALLWEAIINMFENDRSAARGEMAVRKLIIFKHNSELGNAPAHQLFDLVAVQRKEDVEAPRSYDDYIVDVQRTSIPEGVELIER